MAVPELRRRAGGSASPGERVVHDELHGAEIPSRSAACTRGPGLGSREPLRIARARAGPGDRSGSGRRVDGGRSRPGRTGAAPSRGRAIHPAHGLAGLHPSPTRHACSPGARLASAACCARRASPGQAGVPGSRSRLGSMDAPPARRAAAAQARCLARAPPIQWARLKARGSPPGEPEALRSRVDSIAHNPGPQGLQVGAPGARSRRRKYRTGRRLRRRPRAPRGRPAGAPTPLREAGRALWSVRDRASAE